MNIIAFTFRVLLVLILLSPTAAEAAGNASRYEIIKEEHAWPIVFDTHTGIFCVRQYDKEGNLMEWQCDDPFEWQRSGKTPISKERIQHAYDELKSKGLVE